MGLRGIGNALIKFKDVFVPNENLLWGEGLGLKLALITLNTGRLTIPAGCAAGGPPMLEIAKEWANERVQWGAPIGKHEAVAAKIAWMASHTFAMEAIVWLTSGLADRGNVDLRLEAAMAKLFNTEVAWQIADHLVQIRGGRGYETAQSLRGARREGLSGRADHARHAHQPHLRRDERDPASLHRPRGRRSAHEARLQDPAAGRRPTGEKLAPRRRPALTTPPGIRRATSAGRASRSSASSESSPGTWATSSATSRHLSRSIFHAMMRFQAKLERKQMVLFRIVDIGTDLFAMSAAISYAHDACRRRRANRRTPSSWPIVFCREARMRIEQNFETCSTITMPLLTARRRNFSVATTTGCRVIWSSAATSVYMPRPKRSKRQSHPWRVSRKGKKCHPEGEGEGSPAVHCRCVGVRCVRPRPLGRSVSLVMTRHSEMSMAGRCSLVPPAPLGSLAPARDDRDFPGHDRFTALAVPPHRDDPRA